MTDRRPTWQQLRREWLDKLADIDFRIRQQEDICRGYNEPHGRYAFSEKTKAYDEYRVIVPRRIPKPQAE